MTAPKTCSVSGCERVATEHDGGRGFRLSQRALEEQRLRNAGSKKFDPETQRRAHDLLRRVNNEAPLVCMSCIGRYSPPPHIADLFAEVDTFLGPEQNTEPATI